MEWTEDCLSVEEQGYKGDQKDAETFGKHVYVNPFPSSQCPILALAVHLSSCSERTVSAKQQLFIGTDNKNRFGRTLHRVIAALDEEETCILGCHPDDIGTNSLRKDSSSYALGQVYGPTTVYVYLPMGQCLVLSPYSNARVFTANTLLQHLRGATVLAIDESPVSGMKATGIPPHLAVVKKVSELQEPLAAIRSEMENLKTTMANSIPNEVASKVVGDMRRISSLMASSQYLCAILI
ncbi:hypothetical protein GQ600_2813 [Phytophthora cactorum]|nr:hypothetical protein GQ600_2813 [Phytophthora cactorum]